MTPAAVHHGHATQLHAAPRRRARRRLRAHPERFVRKPPVPPELPTAAWINKRRHEGGRSLNSNTKRLTGLDRLRALADLARSGASVEERVIAILRRSGDEAALCPGPI